MKMVFLLLLTTFIFPSTWININSNEPKPMSMNLISSDIENTKITFKMDGFHLKIQEKIFFLLGIILYQEQVVHLLWLQHSGMI